LTRLIKPFDGVASAAPFDVPGVMTTQGSAAAPWSDYPAAGRRPSSAVVMLFIPGRAPGAPAEVVFTRRSTSVRSHKGQIGFPGGRVEAGDATPAHTALRELEEELGVPRNLATTVAALATIPALDGSSVCPIAAFADVTLAAMKPSAD
jgi:8-oxo-dGTP pyrophosphatase MutT (NUDIX family)